MFFFFPSLLQLIFPESISKNSHKIPNVGAWIRVKYLRKRSKHQFIGKIISNEINEEYEIKLLKKSKIVKFYIFLENDDT